MNLEFRFEIINPYFSCMNAKSLSPKDKNLAFSIYLILAAIFIASLVVSNLIFQKFLTWDFFGIYTFEISVGILPYPVTFLVTDLISEIYGKKKANQVVITGIVASAFSLLIIMVSDAAPATSWSPIGNEVFHQVFGLSEDTLVMPRNCLKQGKKS